MIKHIVCFKLKEGESPEKAKEVLLSMKGNVSFIKDIEVGTDFLHSDRSYDVYLSVVLVFHPALLLAQSSSLVLVLTLLLEAPFPSVPLSLLFHL